MSKYSGTKGRYFIKDEADAPHLTRRQKIKLFYSVTPKLNTKQLKTPLIFGTSDGVKK